MNRLINVSLLTILAQLLFIGKLDAQSLIFSDSFESCFPGSLIVWDAGGDGVSWANAANWQGNSVPADGDSVSIQIPGAQTIVYDNTLGTRSIRCLDSNRALSITGGSLTILETGNLGSSISVVGGALKVTGRLRVELP